MSKVSDRIQWEFVVVVLKKVGFHPTFVKIGFFMYIICFLCLCGGWTNLYFFKPERRLKQGDPLSHYHFILCVEYLSSLLIKEESLGVIQGLKVSHAGTFISLFYFLTILLYFVKHKGKSLFMLILAECL